MTLALVNISRTPREIVSPRCFGDFESFIVRIAYLNDAINNISFRYIYEFKLIKT